MFKYIYDSLINMPEPCSSVYAKLNAVCTGLLSVCVIFIESTTNWDTLASVMLQVAAAAAAVATQVDENVASAESAQSEIETVLGAWRGEGGRRGGRREQTHRAEVSAKNKHKMS